VYALPILELAFMVRFKNHIMRLIMITILLKLSCTSTRREDADQYAITSRLENAGFLIERFLGLIGHHVHAPTALSILARKERM